MEENMGNTKKKQDVMQDEAVATIEGDGASVEKSCCCKKHKKRDDKEYNDLMNRLSRIEGQVRGIKRMLEEDAYCPDILIQVSAINAALTSFNKVLLANHIRTCVTRDIREGKDETVEELIEVCQKVMK
jgi:DNA-binding FrmR family transcriptional regulator